MSLSCLACIQTHTHLVRPLMQAYRQMFWGPAGQSTVTAWPEDCFTPLSLLHKHSEWPSTVCTYVEVKPAFRKEGRKKGRVLEAWTEGVEQFIFKKFKSALTYESLGQDDNEGNAGGINAADIKWNHCDNDWKGLFYSGWWRQTGGCTNCYHWVEQDNFNLSNFHYGWKN